jgi:MFS family permease
MDKFGRRWAAIPTLIGMAVTMAALLFADGESSFFIAAIAMSLANALGSGVIMVLGADLAPAGETNEFLAGYRLLVDLGQAATPPVISAITAAASLPAAMGTMAVVSLVGAGLLIRYLPKYGIR